jgi:glycerol-3-phosphate responsive antiterminator
MQKAHHHIGHLHAGVVDVVLHVDLLAGGAQQAHKRVAENGVAQVADVRGLVGIDAGVLDKAEWMPMYPAPGNLEGGKASSEPSAPQSPAR